MLKNYSVVGLLLKYKKGPTNTVVLILPKRHGLTFSMFIGIKIRRQIFMDDELRAHLRNLTLFLTKKKTL